MFLLFPLCNGDILFHAKLTLESILKAFSVQNISDGPDEKKIETEETDEDENKPVKNFDIFDDSRSMAHVDKPLTVKL